MALIFMDGFDWTDTVADFPTKWDNGDCSIASGRFGSGAQFTNRSNNLDKSGLTAHATWIFGFAAQRPGTHYLPVILFDGTPSGTAQVSLLLHTDGTVQVCQGNAGTALGTSGVVIPATGFAFVEWKVTIGNSGSYEVRVNDVNILSGSGDTQQSSNASAASFRFGQNGSSSSASFIFDDLYVCDGSGSAPANDFLGDCKVETIMPSGNGNSSQFDGSDGNQTDNYLLVDETDPDDDTTYVESADVGDKDTYAYGNLATGAGTVYGINIQPRFRKTDAGTRSIVTVARHSGSEVDSSAFTATTTYAQAVDIRETKPGGGAWSISDINGAEFGVKVYA
jgi:hypothetical protein